MKTIRTIIATLSAILLTFAVVAWFSVRRNAAFIQRTIYQGFDQTFVVALVMGCAFLLIAIILTVAIVSTDGDEEDEEDEEPFRTRARPRAQASAERRPASQRGEQPYRRVTRDRSIDQSKPPKATADKDFARPKARAEEKNAPRQRERAADRPDEIAIGRTDAPLKREKKAPKPAAEPVEEYVETPTPVAAPRPMPAPKPAVEPGPVSEAELEPETAEGPKAVRESEPAELPEERESFEAPEEDPETPEEAPEMAQAAPAEAPVSEEPVSEPHREEGTVRCVFCGSTISRDCLFCPRCVKKR